MLLRRAAGVLLWALAAVGVACAIVWGLAAAGVVKPLIVVSGSMEPQIMTGDLVVAVRAPVADLRVGDVASLPSDLADALVTHRIRSIALEGDVYRIDMKGDANEFADALDYLVPADALVWVPRLTVPGAGTVVARMMTPPVAVPLLVGILALVGVVWLVPVPARGRRPADADAAGPATAEAELEEAGR